MDNKITWIKECKITMAGIWNDFRHLSRDFRQAFRQGEETTCYFRCKQFTRNVLLPDS